MHTLYVYNETGPILVTVAISSPLLENHGYDGSLYSHILSSVYTRVPSGFQKALKKQIRPVSLEDFFQ